MADNLSTDVPSILFDAVSGERLQRSGQPGGASQTRGVMVGLHLAHFAGPWLRALFFGSGLLGCLMVASGVVMWAVKERPKHLKAGRIGFGLRLVDALNIGTVAGLPIAFSSFFWANRVLPVSLDARAAMEANVFLLRGPRRCWLHSCGRGVRCGAGSSIWARHCSRWCRYSTQSPPMCIWA